jgi:hypothetical protein
MRKAPGGFVAEWLIVVVHEHAVIVAVGRGGRRVVLIVKVVEIIIRHVSASLPSAPLWLLHSATILAKVRTTSLGIWSQRRDRV